MYKIVADNFAWAHKGLLVAIHEYGIEIPTDYDKPNEKKSLDIVASIEVQNPWNPPIFSKAVWDTKDSLMNYADEVVEGSMDAHADTLSYTYHDRFKDQLDGTINELRRNAFTRRAQFITWRPDEDLGAEYPPCFQRAWLRLREGKLDMHTHWRSRDALKAWGSNVFAFAHLHRKLSETLGFEIGTYREFIDSAHVYGRDREKMLGMLERPLEEWEWPLEEIVN
jgi:thymidylate synthase